MADIECTHCGTGNRPGRRFCAGCGAALLAACKACGFGNGADEKFCGGCGASLEAPPSVPATPPLEGEGERRPITVMFADIVGYTRMSQVLDPEDVHALLGRFFETVDEIVLRHGGSVDKHIGDAVMAVFGAPIAHGDDALRAVRSAAEIQKAMPALGAAVKRPLEVHIGIAGGEVMASGLGSTRHRAYSVIGQSVNLAARLLDLATAGETILDASVYAATRHVAFCTPIEGVTVKGIDAPIDAFRLIELREGSAREGERQFVGRGSELAQLGQSLRSTAADGTGCAIIVRGDAGIGKSRLVGELRRLALAEGFTCHTGLVLDFGMATGRDAIREIVASLLDLPRGSDHETRRVAIERAMAADPELTKLRPFLFDLVDLPQPTETRALYEAMDNAARARSRAAVVTRLIEMASHRQPVLLVVEDVHWADRVTLNYLAAIARGGAAMPAVLAMTSRLHGDPLDALWRASVQGTPLLTVDLGPLASRDAMTLASGFVSAPLGFAEKCVARAAGNPLFLEQLMRAAGEDEDRLPASLHSLVLARTDQLPERDRAGLRAASVIGQRFPLALVRRLAQLPDYACDNLVAHHLIRPEGDDFLFAHALIRDGVYASLTRARRAELHRAAADSYGDRDPTLRAEHLDRAEAPEAPQAYLHAAQTQTTALHLDRALTLADRGAVLAKAAADIVALNLLRGRLRCDAGEGKPAIEAYAIALQAANDPADRCRALLGIAAGQRLLASIDASLAALAEAEPIAVERGLTRELAELHYIRGNLQFALGNAAACHTEHEAALACARLLGDPAWEARALSGLADAAYAIGRMRTAFTTFGQCIALCDAHGLTRIAIPNRVMVGMCRTYLAEFDEGIADIREARARAVQVGDRHGEMFTLNTEGLLLALCNRYDETDQVIQRGLVLAEAIGAQRYQAMLLFAMAESALERGRADEARDAIEHSLALSRETGMRFCGPLLLGVKARLEEDAGVRAHCHGEAEALLAQGGPGHNAIGYYRYVLEDAIARREWSRALEQVAALGTYTRAEPLPYTDFLIARGRTLIGLSSRPDDPALRAEFDRLRAEAARLRWLIRWPEWAVRDGE